MCKKILILCLVLSLTACRSNQEAEISTTIVENVTSINHIEPINIYGGNPENINNYDDVIKLLKKRVF